jgi:hypothetical protein
MASIFEKGPVNPYKSLSNKINEVPVDGATTRQLKSAAFTATKN